MPNQPEKLMPDGSPIAVNSSGSTRSVPALHPRENLQTRTVRLNFGTPATSQALCANAYTRSLRTRDGTPSFRF
jgi:hypothetical protein